MILGLLGHLDLGFSDKEQSTQASKTNERILGKISEGMKKEALIDSWGKPSRFEKSYNFYADSDQTRYYYENAPCQTVFYGCVVVLEDNQVVSFSNIKAELVE